MAENNKLARLNILLVGKTGVGKSTLINSIFGKELAKAGVGRPVTKSINELKTEGSPLVIYDTPGLELSGENSADNLLKEFVGEVKSRVYRGDTDEMFHCIWYCIDAMSGRLEPSEVKFLEKFTEKTKQFNIPVIIVLTKSLREEDVEAMKKTIVEKRLPIAGIAPVLAADYSLGKDVPPVKAHGLKELVDLAYDVLPDAQKNTLAAVQVANLDLKRNAAQKAVVVAAAAAAVTGAAPIPFSDAMLLVPTQIAMLTSITVIFRLPVQKGVLRTLATAAIGITGTTVIGKTVVSNLLKMIPGAGTMAGGAISATTAAALTTALGNAYIGMLMKVCRGEMDLSELSTKKGQELMKQEFQNQMKAKKN